MTLRNLAIQALIFFTIFQSISMLRETSMLSTDTKIDSVNNLLFSQVPTLMGETVSLHSQSKKTVIYFFAPWCQVCHVSIGNLQALYEKNNHLEVIAVALDYADADEVMAFTKQHQLTFPIALGNEEIKQAFSISGYPSYYVISEDNSIVGKSMGYSSELGLYLRSL
jgi:thiol-disulfide isomerase/thioredoxin